jgi:hypothetical protein
MRTFFRVSLLVVTACSCVTMPSRAEDPFRRIIWNDELHTVAAFIPADVMSSMPITQLPLGQREKEALQFKVELYRDPPAPGIGSGWPQGLPECMPSGYPLPTTAPDPDAWSLEAEIARADVTLIGEVVALVPGWYAPLSTPAAMAYVHVTRVLADVGGRLSPGQLVAVQTPNARLEIDGVVLCSESAAEQFYQPQVGDLILITGYPWPADPDWIHNNKRFQIVNGMIRPQPYPTISTRASVPVEALISAATAAARPVR